MNTRHPTKWAKFFEVKNEVKTYKNLYTQVYDSNNLVMSWRKVRRGKRYNPVASAFEDHLDQEMTRLYYELVNETWQAGGYRSFTVHDPKRRKISAAAFRDRVVHHTLVAGEWSVGT